MGTRSRMKHAVCRYCRETWDAEKTGMDGPPPFGCLAFPVVAARHDWKEVTRYTGYRLSCAYTLPGDDTLNLQIAAGSNYENAVEDLHSGLVPACAEIESVMEIT